MAWQQGQNNPARTARSIASPHQSVPKKPVTWGWLGYLLVLPSKRHLNYDDAVDGGIEALT